MRLLGEVAHKSILIWFETCNKIKIFMNMKNFIKKHCWSCEYFNLYNNNKCELTNLTKSKNSACKNWKLVKCLR